MWWFEQSESREVQQHVVGGGRGLCQVLISETAQNSQKQNGQRYQEDNNDKLTRWDEGSGRYFGRKMRDCGEICNCLAGLR